MKTLTIYFLKRWWGFYLTIFLLDVVVFGTAMGNVPVRGMLASIPLLLFLNYLQKGGKGAFWIPLTRKEVGRVYWLVAVLVPTLIFGTSDLLGAWLSAMATPPSIWSAIKHSVFFMGIVSLLLLKGEAASIVFFVPMLIYFQWPDFFHSKQGLIESIWFLISMALIAFAFFRAEFFLEKQTAAASPKKNFNDFFAPAENAFRRSKRTGMNWVFAKTFWPLIGSYFFIVAVFVLIPHLLNFRISDPPLILLVVLFPTLRPLFLMFNLRVARVLPFSSNQLAGFLVAFTTGAVFFIGILLVALAITFEYHWDHPLRNFLAILEGTLIVQTTRFSVSGIGLRGYAGIYACVVIFVFAGFLLIFLPFVIGIRMEIPVVISLPAAFLIHRYYIRTSSELYRPQKDNLNIL